MNENERSCVLRSRIDDMETKGIATFLLSLKHSQSVNPNSHSYELQDVSSSTFGFLSIDTPSALLDACEVNKPSGMTVEVATNHGPCEIIPYRGYAPVKSPSFVDCRIPHAKLLADSRLVLLEDRDLVPHALFVSVAQLQMCHLTQLDRVGCYKGREIGFVGLACKHCGGAPGFGRYFPENVRNLAQTTTSKTMLQHISSKCRYTPSYVRDAVLRLQEIQIKQYLASGHRRYGSRKVFFERVWSRLHSKSPSRVDNS